MPKVELHVHLDGSFDELAVFAEAKAQLASGNGDHLPDEVTLFGETLPVRHAIETCASGEDFKKLVSCKDRRSLHAMFRCFEIFLPIVRGRLQLLEELAYRFVERQAAQSVVYTEVRYSPHLLADGGLMVLDNGQLAQDVPSAMKDSADAILAAITSGLRRGEKKFGVTVNQLLCCLAFRPDWANDVVRLAELHKDNFPCAVVGIDVAGGEEWFEKPNDKGGPDLHTSHARALQRAQALNLNITIHAGEDSNFSNVSEAIKDHGATRIGHGYRLVEDKAMMHRMIELGIHFECCPTSSYETGGWHGSSAEGLQWDRHPMKELIAAGASVGLNSDDPSVFSTSLTDEFQLMSSHGEMDFSQLVSCTMNAADATFLPELQKQKLRQELQTRFNAIH
eukprot:CAMPEP_0114342060 /NCGR_PEP_ID=MMETSP0101-20121206/9515_1 /TAXON_ID=38822 ORGANISM="Pteridomonas danica, Strain PT" /NCGR_SAMPLE_ID=MMETSP0101 /ASSEMBLY_ACC=CAM_ASM_000211 /LENGTH=393 /DNA_ID=CAMNT_0001475977 /DNA_START=206 /DNA_END=1387 /DNA_ORIENTATION=-